MLIIGLTGSIGMGKSETAKLFAKQGIPVFDADQVVHELYARGGNAVGPIGERFPEAVTTGRVDRAVLSRAVLEDPDALDALDRIVHPLVRERQATFLDTARAAGADMVVLDIPLLFETRDRGSFDKIIVVSTAPDIQRERVLARPGMAIDKFEHILARQTPDAEKRAKADFVIETSGGLADAEQQVANIIAQLREGK
jgi:dephospho-CoA kinase